MAEREPLDEDAAWAEIVASYDTETANPDRDWPADGPHSDLASADQRELDDDKLPESWPGGAEPPVNSITVLSAAGPRDWRVPEPHDDADHEDDAGMDEDEDHFIPPEPPPLPDADTTTRFAWLAAVGGPLLLIGAIVFQQPLTWWVLTLGLGGFLGGFTTLVARMGDDEDGYDDPGRGAVV